MGNMSPPTVDFWATYGVKHPHSVLPAVMNYIITLFWVLAQVFIFIILTNFFIALVSQAYEDTMRDTKISRYHHMAELNKECY
jgi:hypothetical protein